jgi:hypothetical protein
MSSETSTNSLQPWQFFVLAALGCATAVTFIARGAGLTAVVLLSVMMGTAAFVGMTVLRTVRPLVSPEEDKAGMVGQRTRLALGREKMLALKSIKELEFDKAMGKLSEADWHEMSGRLRARAARIMRQLDAGAGYRDQVERDLAKRLGGETRTVVADRSPQASVEQVCSQCDTANDEDARFCKSCGQALSTR